MLLNAKKAASTRIVNFISKFSFFFFFQWKLMKTFKIWQTFSNSLLYFSYIFPDQKPKTAEKRCRANLCNQDPSYDNILDNYCQADFGEYFDFWLTFTYIYKIIRSFERLKSKGLCLLKFIFYLFFCSGQNEIQNYKKTKPAGTQPNKLRNSMPFSPIFMEF